MANEKTHEVGENNPTPPQKTSGWEITNTITKWLFNPIGLTTTVIAWGCVGLFPAAGTVGAGIGVIAGIVTLTGMTLWALQALLGLWVSLFNNSSRSDIKLQRPFGKGIAWLEEFYSFYEKNKKSLENRSRFPFLLYLGLRILVWIMNNPGTTFLIIVGIGGFIGLSIAIYGFGAMAPLFDSMVSNAFDAVSAFIHATGWESLTPLYTLQYFSWQIPFLMTLAPVIFTHGMHTIIDTFTPEKPESNLKTKETKARNDDDTSTRPEIVDDLQNNEWMIHLRSSHENPVFSSDNDPTLVTNSTLPGASPSNGLGGKSE